VVTVQPGVVPAESPVVDPGTAVVTTLHRPGETAYVRVRLAEGEVLPVTVEVPDRDPERDRAPGVVGVRLIAPEGAEDATDPVAIRPVGDLRTVGVGEVRAEADGTWTVEITASEPSRVRVALGEVPVPDQEASTAIADWLATEPGSVDEPSPATSVARPTATPDRVPGLAGTQAGGVPLLVVLSLPIVVISLIALRPFRRLRERRR
jgi:hypothetical protein